MRPILGLGLVLGLVLSLALVGCKKGDALVIVKVSSTVALDGITRYAGPASAAGKHADIEVPVGGAVPAQLASGRAFTFGIRVPAEDTGVFLLDLTAYKGDAALLSKAGTTTTSAGSPSDLDLVFGAADLDGGTDGATDASGDGATCPMTCEEAGVGCGKVTTVCGMTITCTKPCALNEISPSVGRVGDTVLLEGRFGANTMVNFPGGMSAPATLLGAERATVTVPAGAITGPVTITVDGATPFAAAPFKVTSFQLGMQSWANSYPQTDAARLVPPLNSDRGLHGVISVGRVVVAVGGVTGNMGPSGSPLNSIETAEVNADGTLQPFRMYSTVGSDARTLMTPRAGLNLLRAGVNVIALGGWNNGQGGTVKVYETVERADINGDGSGIQTFTANASSMNTARYLAGARVIGDYVYVFGGFTSGSVYDGTAMPTATVERAPILVSGLGPFEVVGNGLTTPRGGAGVEVIGDTVYVLGGLSNVGALKSYEKAKINGDGSLGPFTDAGMLDDVHAAFATLVMGGKLYLISGVATVAGRTMPDNVATVVAADIQPDNSLGAFTLQPGVMTRVHAGFGQGVIVGNHYYVIGGGGGGGPSSNRDVEYTSINARGDIAPFTPYAQSTTAHRTAPAALVYRDHVYLFGGQTAAALQTIESAPIAPDGSIGAFNQLPTMLSTPRTGAAVAVLNSTIYVYGGGTNLASADAFFVDQTGALQLAGFTPPAMTTGRQNFQLVAIANPSGAGGWLYAIGGDGSVAGTDKTMERAALDPGGNVMGAFTAISGTPLNNPHSNASGALVGSSYYLFGELNSNITSADVAMVDTSGSLGNFGPSTPGVLTHARWSATTFVVGPRLFLAGGSYNNVTVMPDPTVDAVAITPMMTGGQQLTGNFMPLSGTPLMLGRRAPVSVTVGNFAYVMNGYNPSGGDLNSIEQAQLR